MRRMIVALGLLLGCSPPASAPPPAVGAARVRVRAIKVEPKQVSGARTFPGVLEPWQRATLGARVAGHLATLRVDRGSVVKQGEVVATLAIPGLAEGQARAEAKLHTAEADLANARDLEARANKVAAANSEAIATAEVAELRGKAAAHEARMQAARAELAEARAQADDAILRAPFGGTVTARFADPGAVLGVGSKVVEIVALDPLRLAVDVPERDAPRVRVGQGVEVLLPTAGDRKLSAKVARFAAALDPATHTLRIEIDVPNHDGSIVAGTEARATVDFGAHSALLVPADALIVDGAKTLVFVVDGDHAKKQLVRVAYDDGRESEIASGLSPGQEVIVGGRGLLSDGDAVEVAR